MVIPTHFKGVGTLRTDTGGLLRGRLAQTTDGFVNYSLYGKGDGSRPLVVTLHGLMGTMGTFKAVADWLMEAGYDVLLFDLFGFGLSSAPHKLFNAKLYVRQTLDLLTALHAAKSKFCVIGFSMGGLIAMELARAVPERVSAIFLIAPAGLVPLSGAEKAQINGLQLARTWRIPVASMVGKLATFHTASEDFFDPDSDSERAQEAARKCADMYNSNPEKFAKSWLKCVRDMRLGGNHEAFAGLATSGVRTMFLWGDLDETVPLYAIREKLRHFFPASPVKIIQHSGHNLLLDHSDTIASVAAQWFSQKTSPGGQFSSVQRFQSFLAFAPTVTADAVGVARI